MSFWWVIPAIPAGVGLCIGKMCVGVWKERR
jgi:hypothetical protein